MRPENILTLLGRLCSDSKVINMLQEFGVKKYRPALDDDDLEAMTDWFPNAELGIEFGFKDKAYLEGLDPSLRRKGSLVFYEVIYYGEHPKMSSFQGELPFALMWSDDRTKAVEKMNRYQHPMRSYLRDVWELPNYRVIVSYMPDESAIADIAIYIPDAPWKNPIDNIYPMPSLTVISALFGKSPNTPEFERVFRPFGVMYQLELSDIPRRIDVREEFGFALNFGLASISTEDYSNKVHVLVGITMSRERDMDARAWTGELPFGIQWDDTPPMVFTKVGIPPIKKFEDHMSGSVFWEFKDYSLQVMYSTFDNLVYRAMMSWCSP